MLDQINWQHFNLDRMGNGLLGEGEYNHFPIAQFAFQRISSQASKLRWFKTTTYRLTGVDPRATNVAKILPECT